MFRPACWGVDQCHHWPRHDDRCDRVTESHSSMCEEHADRDYIKWGDWHDYDDCCEHCCEEEPYVDLAPSPPTEVGSLILVTHINQTELPAPVASYRTGYAWYRVTDEPWPAVPGGPVEAFALFDHEVTGWHPATVVAGF